MLGSGSALVAALGLLLMGAAPAEFMLCFHRDGKVEVERYQESCCESAREDSADCGNCPERLPQECPDDQCRDLPLTSALQAVQGSPSSLPELAASTEPTPIEPPLVIPPFTWTPEPRSGDLDPPGSPPLDFLRTVVLRL